MTKELAIHLADPFSWESAIPCNLCTRAPATTGTSHEAGAWANPRQALNTKARDHPPLEFFTLQPAPAPTSPENLADEVTGMRQRFDQVEQRLDRLEGEFHTFKPEVKVRFDQVGSIRPSRRSIRPSRTRLDWMESFGVIGVIGLAGLVGPPFN